MLHTGLQEIIFSEMNFWVIKYIFQLIWMTFKNLNASNKALMPSIELSELRTKLERGPQ